MFKELGALIDAAGEVAAKSLRISARAVKEALSDNDDDDDHPMGLLVENPERFHENCEKIDLKMFDNKSKNEYIIVNTDEVNKEE